MPATQLQTIAVQLLYQYQAARPQYFRTSHGDITSRTARTATPARKTPLNSTRLAIAENITSRLASITGGKPSSRHTLATLQTLAAGSKGGGETPPPWAQTPGADDSTRLEQQLTALFEEGRQTLYPGIAAQTWQRLTTHHVYMPVADTVELVQAATSLPIGADQLQKAAQCREVSAIGPKTRREVSSKDAIGFARRLFVCG